MNKIPDRDGNKQTYLNSIPCNPFGFPYRVKKKHSNIQDAIDVLSLEIRTQYCYFEEKACNGYCMYIK